MIVLLVEDSPTLRHVMSQHITEAGHEVLLAEDGEQALQTVSAQDVDMIFMDVEMPGLNGFDTTRLIRESLGDHWMPIVFVTGNSDDENLSEGIRSGGDDYLIKPLSQTVVAAKIIAMERICAMRDQLTSAHARLKRASQHDELTGLLNYRTFKEKAREEWRLSMRLGNPVSMLIIDIDYFDEFKKHASSAEADFTINRIFQALGECINRPSDIIGRMHEDKMICMLPKTNVSLAKKAGQLVIKKINALGIKHPAETVGGNVSISAGVSTLIPSPGVHVNQQISITERALSKAKESRACSVFSDDTPQKHVLIIEDRRDRTEIIQNLLDSSCPTIYTANGEEAVAFAERLEPSAIIVSIDSDSFHAGTIIQEIADSPSVGTTPIIIMATERSSSFDIYSQKQNVRSAFTFPLNEPLFLSSVKALLR